MFVTWIVDYAIPWSSLLGIFAIIAILCLIFNSSILRKQSEAMVENFTDNLSAREKAKKQK